MDRIEQMTTFVRVAQMHSFTEAARSLGLPKASVSTAVARLESRLGSRLLQRTTRRVELTHDGALFYERCRDLLSDVEELESLFQQTDEALSGTVRVDMNSRMARKLVIPALPRFLAAHPGLHVELGATDRMVDLIREGYDFVVRVGTLSESGLVARRVGEMTLLNLASPDYLRKHGRPRGLKDLQHHFQVNYVGTLGQKPDGWEYEEDGEWKTLPMRSLVTVNSGESYMAACHAGLGIIQVPGGMLRAELKSGALVEVLPRLRAKPMPVSLVYPHRRHLSRRVRVFMDWLEMLVQTHGGVTRPAAGG